MPQCNVRALGAVGYFTWLCNLLLKPLPQNHHGGMQLECVGMNTENKTLPQLTLAAYDSINDK
jgi:hypothetical protein